MLPFFFGAVLALYGIWRIGAHGFWIVLVSLALVPSSLVTFQYVTADPATTWYPINPLFPLAVVFGPLLLVGLVWGYRERQQLRQSQVR